MAINTRRKRYASLVFGDSGMAGTRIPVGISSVFLRATTLGLYHPGTDLNKPEDAWVFCVEDRVFEFEPTEIVFEFDHTDSVFQFTE